MQKQHERLGGIPTGHTVELDPIGLHVAMLAQGGVQHAVWGRYPLGPLEEEDRVAQEIQEQL